MDARPRKKPSSFLALGVATLLTSTTWAAGAAAQGATDCSASAGQAITNWAVARKISIGPSDRTAIADTFCASTTAIVSEGRFSMGDATSKAPAVIADFLDRQAVPSRPARTLDATLRASLGAPGFSKPTFKTYGVVTVVYKHAVDTFWLADRRVDVAPTFLVRTGGITFKGLKGSTVACQGQIQVSGAAASAIVC